LEPVTHFLVQGIAGLGFMGDFLGQYSNGFSVGGRGVWYGETRQRFWLHFVVAVGFGRKDASAEVLADMGVQQAEQVKAGFPIG